MTSFYVFTNHAGPNMNAKFDSFFRQVDRVLLIDERVSLFL